jgi:hypothetical protein
MISGLISWGFPVKKFEIILVGPLNTIMKNRPAVASINVKVEDPSEFILPLELIEQSNGMFIDSSDDVVDQINIKDLLVFGKHQVTWLTVS